MHPSWIDHTGEKFDKWTVIEYRPTGRFLCRCDCGAERVVLTTSLMSGKSKSCGCRVHETLREKRANLIGKRFGMWLVMGRSTVSAHQKARWLCRCDCGTETPVVCSSLVRGLSTNCGCRQYENTGTRTRIDLSGRRFGYWFAISLDRSAPKKGGPFWKCQCDCGVERVVSGTALREGLTKSCGCKKTALFAGQTTLPLWKLNLKPLEYHVWKGMIRRCDPKNKALFPGYAGRGITVCPRWTSYRNFIEDMGIRPRQGLSLERMNNDLGYSPKNCIWADAKQQANNRRPPVRRREVA
jgi:hypothetical protein